MKDKHQNLIALVIFLMAVGFVLYVAVAKGEPIPEPTYTNYNPLNEISQERIDDWREVAYEQAQNAQQNQEKIGTLRERRAEEAVSRSATSHTTTQLTSRATGRTTPKITQTTQGVEQWRELVAKYFPANQVNNALLCIKLESGGNPNAVSKTNDHGLFQIHRGLSIYGQGIYDPETNIKIAYEYYYKPRGWRPWYAVKGILW